MGGMGEIYLAKSRGAAGFEKTVIIKKILDHLAEEEEFVTKFLDEGRIVVNLTHGNIVPVFDMGEEDGEYFIAMDYVPGRDLREVLKRVRKQDKRMPIHLAVHIVTEACKGLDYAHRRTDDAGNSLGIVHRDVSPSNILISREGEVKVIDFGIARATSRAAKTVSGRIQGKICYMSPEQAGGQSVDQRSDIFSTGVVLYEMLTGQRPFQGESDLQSLDLVRKCKYDTPSEHNPEIPAELDAIVEKALERDRDERYQSIDKLHVDLLEWLYSGGRAVTSQQLAEFCRKLFPEGIERDELRKARDASTDRSADEPMNLDDVLQAELDKLQENGGAQGGIDPLRTTATGLDESSAVSGGGRTATLQGETPATPRIGVGAPSLDQNEQDEQDDQEDAADDPDEAPQPGDASEPSRPLAEVTDETPRDEERPNGFKRWIAIAMGIGLIAGAAAIYAYASTEYGKVRVETAPAGASIEVDGSIVSGVQTPTVIELETGKRNLRLFKPSFEDKRFTVTVQRGKTLELSDEPVILEPKQEGDEAHEAWVIVNNPSDATLQIDDEKKSEGKAKIRVAPGEQILVEARHPDCQTHRKIYSFEEASDGIEIDLDCPEPTAQALEPDAGLADVENVEKSADKDKPAPSPYEWVSFRVDPPEATLRVDDKPIDAGDRLKLRRNARITVAASHPGYTPVEKRLRVSQIRGNRYTIELERAPMGCLKFRPVEPGLALVAIDGEVQGWTGGKKYKLPAGRHNVTVSNPKAGKAEETHVVDVSAGSACNSLVVWESQAAQDPTSTN